MTSLPDRDLGQSALSAFRSGIPLGGRPFTAADDDMIVVTTLLRHASVAPTRAIGNRVLQKAVPVAERLLVNSLSTISDATEPSSALHVFRQLAQHTLDLGDLTLTTQILDPLERLAPPDNRVLGHILVSRAHTESLWGRLDVGEEQLNGILRNNDFAVHDEVRLRARHSLAMIAHYRGNIPAAEVECHAVIQEAAGRFPVAGGAHGSLAISSAMRGNFDDAIRYSWAAFVCFEGRPLRQIVTLGNMAQILLDAGHPRPARSAAAWVIAQAPESPAILPFYGSYAIASAALGDRDGVEWAIERVQPLARSKRRVSWAIGQALLDCSVALVTVGETTRAGTLRRRALQIAKQHGFHRLEFFSEQEQTGPTPAKSHSLSAETAAIAAAVTAMEPAGHRELVHAG